jgi:ankyrin repeat protein
MVASRASLKPATESTNSITESADDASVNRVRSEDSGGEFHDRQKQFKRQSSSNSSTNDTIAPVTRREEFDEGSDAEDGEKEEVLGQRGKRDLGAVVPSVASIEAAEVISLQKSKPKLEQKKSTKGVHRGEQLTSEAAVQFMILERQALDEEFAAMRRENEKLRRELQMHQAEPSAFVSRPTSAALAGRSPDGATSAALMKKYQDDAEKLRRENEDLNRKKQEMERLLEEQRRVAALAKSQRIESVMDSASARSQRPQSSSAEPSKPKPPMQRSASMGQPDGAIDLPTTDRQYSALPVILWEGGKLWKVPYNGRGMPEERMVMIKKAQRPGVGARPVRVLANGVDSRAYGSAAAPVAYIQYPPTIIWFGADKPQDEKFARELLLTSGTYLVEGHQTPAFWKMLTRGAPMPPKELCFSIVTSTRTLDLAAETLREANAWKNAIHTLLVILTTNKEWAINSLHRSEPTWHHDAMVEPTKANSRKAAPPVIDSQAAVEKPNKSGSMKEQMFTATRLNNFSALDDLLRSGVPVNLMDSKTSDTPLMMACRLNFPVIAKLCLDYGAKNDPHPDFGQTALHAAVSSKAFECCEVLMEASAPSKADAIICNLPDSMGLTPLHLAALLGHVKILELLIQHGGDISRRDGRGWTALHCCVSKGHESALALMMDCGGDDMIELIDKEGNTPLHTAAEEGHLECARLLLETAANPDLMNAQGFTPFAIANARGHNKLGSLILAYIDGSSGFGFGHSRKPNIREQRTPSKTPARTPGGTVMGRLVDSPLAMQRGQEMLQHSNQCDHRNQLYGYSYHPTISTEPVHQYNVHGNYESPVKSMGLPRPHTTPVVSSPTPFAQQPASRTSQAVELDPVSQMNLNSDYRVISRAGQRNSNTSDAGTPSKRYLRSANFGLRLNLE